LTGAQKGYAPREQKAVKIERILEDALQGQDWHALHCLDIGSGSGVIADHLSSRFGRTLGLEYDYERLSAGRRPGSDAGPGFVHGDGTLLPFRDATFDVIVCAQVYEHVSSADRLAEEVWRVLRPGGICFFSGPNRFALIEDHYKLPFLSWLPAPLADRYVGLVRGRPRYDAAPRSYWQLRRLWRQFQITDCTAAMLRDPAKYALRQRSALVKPILPLLSYLAPLLPNYNWVLRKPTKWAPDAGPSER
jgi:ubiquinone/menaquinone biosynthesis C-methylase UbiE